MKICEGEHVFVEDRSHEFVLSNYSSSVLISLIVSSIDNYEVYWLNVALIDTHSDKEVSLKLLGDEISPTAFNGSRKSIIRIVS